jgi:5-methylcytosine-specific restriction endonuclease McrA
VDNKCACGCGNNITIKEWNKHRHIKFIHGHNSKLPSNVKRFRELAIKQLGTYHSEETKRKIGEANKIALKGRRPCQLAFERSIITNTGRKHTKEARIKISLAKKGKPFTEEHIANIRKIFTEEMRKKISERTKGENSHFWKGGITRINKRIKQSSEYRLWRNLVFQRDDWTCRKCGVRGYTLHPHHIKSFSAHPELRFEVSNGKTLCHECHKMTDNYGVNKDKVAEPVDRYRTSTDRIVPVACY